MILLSRKTMKPGSFLKVKIHHLTATGCNELKYTTKVLQSGPVLLVLVQTRDLPSHRVQGVLKKISSFMFPYVCYGQWENNLCLANHAMQISPLSRKVLTLSEEVPSPPTPSSLRSCSPDVLCTARAA